MFSKMKQKYGNNMDGAGISNVDATEARERAIQRGEYQAPWLGRHIFGVLSCTFGLCLVAVAVAFATGSFGN